MEEFKIGNATVRIHPGKRTEEERKEAIEKAAVKFLKAVHRKRKVKEGESEDGRTQNVCKDHHRQ